MIKEQLMILLNGGGFMHSIRVIYNNSQGTASPHSFILIDDSSSGWGGGDIATGQLIKDICKISRLI